MAFYVGQKVVCVANGGRKVDPLHLSGLVIGNIYTVSQTLDHPEELGLDLVECPCAKQPEFNPVWHSPFYRSRMFRPAVERKTDISIFTAMLTPKRQSVDA